MFSEDRHINIFSIISINCCNHTSSLQLYLQNLMLAGYQIPGFRIADFFPIKFLRKVLGPQIKLTMFHYLWPRGKETSSSLTATNVPNLPQHVQSHSNVLAFVIIFVTIIVIIDRILIFCFHRHCCSHYFLC